MQEEKRKAQQITKNSNYNILEENDHLEGLDPTKKIKLNDKKGEEKDVVLSEKD